MIASFEKLTVILYLCFLISTNGEMKRHFFLVYFSITFNVEEKKKEKEMLKLFLEIQVCTIPIEFQVNGTLVFNVYFT